MKCMEIFPRNEMRGEINKCYITKVGIHILQEFYYKLCKFEKKNNYQTSSNSLKYTIF